MNKQQAIRLILYLMLLLGGLFYLKYFDNSNTGSTNEDVTQTEDFRSLPVTYTKHAKCRMNCRFIDKDEIVDILKSGKINKSKSDPNDLPCPSFALEGITKDQQEVRIVFADCGNVVRVITAIDLNEDHECYCK